MHKKYVVIFDAHVPAHNKPLTNALLKYIYLNRNDLTGIILAGDFIDVKSLSFHDMATVKEIELGEEYDSSNIVLDSLDQVMGDPDGKLKEKKFLFGNHEDRFNRFLSKHNNDKFGSALVGIETGLKLVQRGYTIKSNWKEDYFQLGNYQIWHGTYTPKYAFNKHAEMYGENSLFGHTHRYNTGYVFGVFAMNCGWMGDRDHRFFGYMPAAQRKQWINAITTVDVVDNIAYPSVSIWNEDYGKVVIDGKVYKG